MKMTIAVETADGGTALWEPTSLDQLGKSEAYLEAVLSKSPELLCLETKRTGVYGPFVVFNQLSLDTPQGRTVYPDIVLLAASGDVVIVEVKLFANPELRDRRVIAQAVEYASSLALLNEDSMARLFNAGNDFDWSALVRSHFPAEEDPDELAATMLQKAADGDVHIVIACDKVPKGVYELARSVSAQSNLGFSLNVVEVSPFVPQDGPAEAIMFVPSARLATEIVARTAISITYDVGSPQPGVTINTTSVEEIEENLAAAAQGETRQSRARSWTNEEIEDVFMGSDDPMVRDLFLFAKNEGYKGQFQSSGTKVSPTFGFYLAVRRPDGTVAGSQCLNFGDGGKSIGLYLSNWPESSISDEVLAEYKRDLNALFGPSITFESRDVYVPLTALDGKLDSLKDVIRKLQKRIDAEAIGS